MKKSYMDKSNNDSSNMKLILSNYYSLVKHIEKTEKMKSRNARRNIPINNVILPRYGERDYAHFATTYHIDYNKPAFYRNLSRLSRM